MAYKITSADIQLIASARTKQRYGHLSETELAAYRNITTALRYLGSIPKDLWFSVSPTANAKTLAGMPQFFMIVSERGIEYGFGASVSPKDFSQKGAKDAVRRAAPEVFRRLPASDVAETTALGAQLVEQGGLP